MDIQIYLYQITELVFQKLNCDFKETVLVLL